MNEEIFLFDDSAHGFEQLSEELEQESRRYCRRLDEEEEAGA